MMIEISGFIAPIPDFPGYYILNTGIAISTLGKGCRDRYDKSKRSQPKELKPRENKNGYQRVYMRRESTGKREDVYIHRIAAEAFVPNPNNLPEVNHKIPDTSKNNYENLEWVSHKENMEYAILYGNQTRDSKGRFTHK